MDTPIKHADYPHRPGTLYDCIVCETTCYCGGGECVACQVCSMCSRDLSGLDVEHHGVCPEPERGCLALITPAR